MIIDQTMQRRVAELLLTTNEIKEMAHTPSGRLSASQLGMPLQHQILYTIGIRKQFDEYTLRKFLRGNHVEDWYMSILKPVKRQIEVSYKGVIGFADAIVDHKDFEFKGGEIPHEVKSVTGLKFKRIQATNRPDHNHELQGALYGLALESDYFVLDYIASDDYRILSYVLKTNDYKDEIDQIITKFDNAKQAKVIPIFEAREKWMADEKYNSYYEWMNLSEVASIAKLEREYPELHKKFINL